MNKTPNETPTRPRTRTVTRIIENEDRKMKIEAVYGLNYHKNQPPYFTLSGSVWYADEDDLFASEPDLCGAITEEILTAFPWLDLMARVHMNNALTGEPLYASVNGWYWFNADEHDLPRVFKGMTPTEPTERAATYLGVDPSYFEGVSTREEFNKRLEPLRPVWQNLARQAIEIYALEPPQVTA